VASSTNRLVIIVDGNKLVQRLGDHTPVPVEVVPFGWTRVEWALHALGGRPVRRMAGQAPFVSDGGHFILDCWFDPSYDLIAVAPQIKALTGVVEHGLFLGMAAQVIVGRDESVEVITRPGFSQEVS
jgi:ribose 5-phosphate isomerase A